MVWWLCRGYLVFQDGAVGVDVLALLWHLDRVVHVVVGGGKFLKLQPTEMSLLSETLKKNNFNK